MRTINVAFAIDQNYIQHLAVAIKSLLENNKDLEFRIYIINGGIDNLIWNKLEKILLLYDAVLINIEIDNILFANLVTNYHFTKAMYYRLLIPKIIDVEKILYLDADIVINYSIFELYSTDITNFYIGGIINPGFTRNDKLNMDKNSKYFNSGVMLINNKMWQKDKISDKVIEFVNFNKKIIQFPDQDGLNAIINGKWKVMSLKYNQQAVIFEKDFNSKYDCYTNDELEEAKTAPVIIHYTGSSKPWHFRNKHPYKALYWRYLKMTPFKRYFAEDLTVLNIIKWIIPNSIKGNIKKLINKDNK